MKLFNLSFFGITGWGIDLDYCDLDKWQPTPVFLPGESQGQGSLGGLSSMGSHRVGHD